MSGKREWFAKEIIAGDLFNDYDGACKSYWHCLATYPPADPAGRRGQWKAKGDFSDWGWSWQDWGPA